MGGSSAPSCIFCRIARGEADAYRVFEDRDTAAFLDHRPLLRGHCLLIPRRHVETLHDLPGGLVGPFFANLQLLARAVEEALEADGTFAAINVKVSQSVPHLHAHVVPRWQGDGLFSPKIVWKRRPYRDQETAAEIQDKIRRRMEELERARTSAADQRLRDR